MAVLLAGFLVASPALSQEMSNDELVRELMLMKEKIKQLESQLKEISEASTTKDEKPYQKASIQRAGGVEGMETRVKRLENAIGREVTGDQWYDRIQLSGVVEAEASYGKTDFKDPATQDTETSDVDLAVVELAVDAKIAEHVDGHVLFKWEADELFVDEGFITLVGSEDFLAYLIAGRQYVPIGYFDSHFLTDPATLLLGETNEGAVVAGYRFGGEMFDISAGVFNGRAKETGKDDKISNFVGLLLSVLLKTSCSAPLTPPTWPPPTRCTTRQIRTETAQPTPSPVLWEATASLRPHPFWTDSS